MGEGVMREDDAPDNDFKNLQLRFALAHNLNRMAYGTSRQLSGAQVMKAWPPTGEYAPRTLLNDFRALALAHGGNRPEESYTSKERIENDLDETFDVWQDVISGDWTVHRLKGACPKCHGSKYYQKMPDFALADFNPKAVIGEAEAIQTVLVDCDCRPA